MNNSPFNFEAATPPLIDENAMHREIERRKLKRQIFALKLSGFLTVLALCLLIVLLSAQSFAVAAVLTVFLFFYLSGYLLIYFLFFSKGISPEQKKFNLKPLRL